MSGPPRNGPGAAEEAASSSESEDERDVGHTAPDGTSGYTLLSPLHHGESSGSEGESGGEEEQTLQEYYQERAAAAAAEEVRAPRHVSRPAVLRLALFLAPPLSPPRACPCATWHFLSDHGRCSISDAYHRPRSGGRLRRASATWSAILTSLHWLPLREFGSRASSQSPFQRARSWLMIFRCPTVGFGRGVNTLAIEDPDERASCCMLALVAPRWPPRSPVCPHLPPRVVPVAQRPLLPSGLPCRTCRCRRRLYRRGQGPREPDATAVARLARTCMRVRC